MAKRLIPKRLFQTAKVLLRRSSAVQETAACARALTGMVGEVHFSELLQTAQLTQGILTAKVIRSEGNVPWPMGISRQLDPEDPAFLPPLGAELPAFARDFTRIGMFGERRYGSVDPWGWFGAENDPMVTVWFSDQEGEYCLGKLPLSADKVEVQQKMSDGGHGIITIQEKGKLRLELFHWPVMVSNQLAWSMVFRVTALEDCDARMALVVCPIEKEGAHPIFKLERSPKGSWKSNGRPIFCVSEIGNFVIQSQYSKESLWRRFSQPKNFQEPSELNIHCSAGQGAGAEIYEKVLKKGETFSKLAIIAPPKGCKIPSMSEYTLWRGAVADFNEIRNSGACIQISEHQSILERATQRLLIDHSEVSLASCLGAVALARLGFTRIAGGRLGHWLNQMNAKQGRTSDIQTILVWACSEFVLWTNERSWLHEHTPLLENALDLLSQRETGTGGFEFFGLQGSKRWAEIWRVAALLNAVRVLRGSVSDWGRWGLAGASAKERLRPLLGESPWSVNPEESASGGSAALLAVGWLGLFAIEDPDLRRTEQFIVDSRLHDGGVLLQGGAHVAASSLLFAVQKRSDPSLNIVTKLSRFASETGSLPSIRHRERGALGDGDDLLSSAMFCFLVLDDLLVQKGKIRLNGLIQQAKELPTPHGKIDIIDGRIIQNMPVEIIYLET